MSEDFHFHLITAHLESGDRPKALTAYRRYEQIVHQELGLLPSPRLRLLADRIAAAATRKRWLPRLQACAHPMVRALVRP